MTPAGERFTFHTDAGARATKTRNTPHRMGGQIVLDAEMPVVGARATRFVQIRQTIPHLTDKMLSNRLKELEAEGIIVRTVTPEMPVRVEYHLTEKGRDLERAVVALSEWTDRWAPASTEPTTPQDAAVS